jgi:hypothetical protein
MKKLHVAVIGLLAVATASGPALAQSTAAPKAPVAKAGKAKTAPVSLQRIGAEKGRTSGLTDTQLGFVLVGGFGVGALIVREVVKDDDDKPASP